MSPISRVPALLCCLFFPSCLIRPPVVLETPEGTIHARSQEVAAQAAQFLEKYSGPIRQALGTAGKRPLVRVGLRGLFEEKLDGYTTEKLIVVQVTVPGWERLFVHELAHWHLEEHWNTLPHVIDEGAAYLLAWDLTGDLPGEIAPPGNQELIDTVLTMDFEDYKESTKLERLELSRTGAWIVAWHGWEKLRKLALDAQAQGLDKIPAAWLAGSLPPPTKPVVAPAFWSVLLPRDSAADSTIHALWRLDPQTSGRPEMTD